MALRRVPIHRIGTRHSLFLGGDRELTMFSGLCAFAAVVQGQTWYAATFGIALWIGALYLLRRAGRSDPRLRDVYLRHLRYQRYYPPHSTPFRANTSAQTRHYG